MRLENYGFKIVQGRGLLSSGWPDVINSFETIDACIKFLLSIDFTKNAEIYFNINYNDVHHGFFELRWSTAEYASVSIQSESTFDSIKFSGKVPINLLAPLVFASLNKIKSSIDKFYSDIDQARILLQSMGA